MAEKPDLQELGSTGLRRSGGTVYEEFLVNLRGLRGARVYREMADNDPTIGSMLYAIEKVITRLEWRVDPYSDNSVDGDVKPEDEEVAAFMGVSIDTYRTLMNTYRVPMSLDAMKALEGSGTRAPDSYGSTVIADLMATNKVAGLKVIQEVNGEYVPFGEHCGKPRFQHSNGSTLFYSQGMWKINDEPAPTGWYYAVLSSEELPPEMEWTTEGYDGRNANPPP
ncbi:MAG: hypothetical protein EBU08_12145, partial [Micrococcales bacterium]|nr:hypothetical protein [Micrococcales bacterium]